MKKITGQSDITSDTSESPSSRSVESLTIGTRSASMTSVKKTKPPWRTVSNAAGAQKDKTERSGILRARLIEATRRALRDMKLTNAEAQTDHIATVLVRDIEVNVQDDLLHRCDKAISTCDIFKHTPENLGFILTHSVATETNCTQFMDKETQTALPETRIFFNKLSDYNTNDEGLTIHQDYFKTDPQLSQTDGLIKKQIDELKRIDDEIEAKSLNITNAELIDTELSQSVDSLKSVSNLFIRKENRISPNDLDPYRCWDLSDHPIIDCLSNLTELTEEIDTKIMERLQNMHLTPLPKWKIPSYNSLHWNYPHQVAFGELITEVTKLLLLLENSKTGTLDAEL